MLRPSRETIFGLPWPREFGSAGALPLVGVRSMANPPTPWQRHAEDLRMRIATRLALAREMATLAEQSKEVVRRSMNALADSRERMPKT